MKSKKMLLVLISAAIIVTLTLGPLVPTAAASAPRQAEQPGEGSFVPGEVLVTLTRGEQGRNMLAAQAVENTVATLGGEIVMAPSASSFLLVKFNSEAELAANWKALAATPGVASVQRNYIYSAYVADSDVTVDGEPAPESEMTLDSEPALESETTERGFLPNDPYRTYQWYLDAVYDTITATPIATNVPCIVLLDTGVDYTHPDLANKVFKGYDAIDTDNDPMDMNGHGTRAAGIAAAQTNNSVGIAGASPNSNILAVRVFGADGMGTSASIAAGLDWANLATASDCGNQNPRIYILSVMGKDQNVVDQAISDAIAGASGRLVVGITGTSRSALEASVPMKFYPGADANVFAVAATENNNRRAYRSIFDSASDPWVDIGAPGYGMFTTELVSLSPVSPYVRVKMDATLAAPVAAGVAARVWSGYPDLTVSGLTSRLVSTADLNSGGFETPIRRVNLYRALGGVKYTLQGQVFDAQKSAPLAGAAVTVYQGTKRVCLVYTKLGGFFTCALPTKGIYKLTAKKAKYVAVTQALTVNASKRDLNMTLSPAVVGTSGDWTVTLLWKGWQPFSTVGKEFDLWVVKPGTKPICYSPSAKSPNPNIIVGTDSFGSGQTEWLKVRKAYKLALQVWVSLWEGATAENYSWPFTSRLTGSGAVVTVYKNNRVMARVTAPAKPVATTADIWNVGSINTVTGKWTLSNRIFVDSKAPKCIPATVDP